MGKDLAKAQHWYKLAALQGDPMAQWSLGQFYWQGIISLQDRERALALYLLSDEGGFNQAAQSISHAEKYLSLNQITEARRRARVCMESNYTDCNATALNVLPTGGVKRDYFKGLLAQQQ